VEADIREVLVLWGSSDAKVAFAVVDPLQRVTSAVEYQKFDSSAFRSHERSLAGLGRPQELINGIKALKHISEHALQENAIYSSDFFKFISTDEYIQITFIGLGTDECNVIFVGLGQEPTNIWAIRFDFDRLHIFVGDIAYIRWLTDKYMGHRAAITGTPIFVS
jgi:hypothetical protein